MASPSLNRVINKSLGELLVERGLLTRQRCDEALEYGRTHGLRLGEALLALGFAGNEMISCALGQQFGLTPVELTPDMVDETLVRRFPREALEEHLALPLVEIGREIMVVISDPLECAMLGTLAKHVPGYELIPQLGDPAQISRCLAAVYADSGRTTESRTTGISELLDILVGIAAREHGSDLVLRSRGDSAVLSVQSPTPGNQQSTRELREFNSLRVSAVATAFAAQGRPLSPAIVPVSIWPEPIANPSGTYVIFAASTSDLSGTALRLRALKVNSAVSGSKFSRSHLSANLLIYSDVGALQDFIGTLVTSAPTLVFQDATRSLFPGAMVYPSAYVTPDVVIAANSPAIVVFDTPAGLATIRAVRQTASVYVAVAANVSGEDADLVAQIINELSPLIMDLRNGCTHITDISADEALKIIREG